MFNPGLLFFVGGDVVPSFVIGLFCILRQLSVRVAVLV